MDFGVLGLDGLEGPENGAQPSQVSVVPHETKSVVLGSRSAKQERSGSGEDDRLDCKMPRTGDFSVAKTMPLQHRATPLLRSNSLVSADSSSQQEQMLSFASNKSETPFLTRSSQITGFPYYHQNTPSANYTRAAGYGSGSLNPGMHGPFSGARGPFTPSQWMELEQQALIYKYINANVPVPSNLLIPLKKSLNPYGLSYPSAGSYVPSYGWGTFHLGYSGSTDPEPGRCRRTDGKKWRCSRDAVPDQKYCERHINRGRHRSRKPVEGQTGHAASSGTANSNVVATTTTSSLSTSVITSGGTSIGQQHQLKNPEPGAANPSADALVNRVQDPRSLSMMSSAIKLKSNESLFAIPKQDILFEESSQSVFGLVSSDSLLNPSQRSSFLDSKSYGGSFLDFGDQESQDQLPVRQFMDEWPKDESNSSVMTWHEDFKSDWTQLSMSIPMAHSEFSSSASSPAHEKFAVSPLRLSREFDPVQMGSAMNHDLTESMHKQTNWIPITFGASMGGPLGEALTNPTSSPQLGSSPTGVLQKSTFRSLSNSSSDSSPIAENKKTPRDGARLCHDVLGSTM